MSWWYYRSNRTVRNNHPQPVQTDEGIKARSKNGKFVANWWANRWLQTLESLIDRSRLGRGKTYAIKGQVLSLEEKDGGFFSRVQGSRYIPYDVSLRMDHLDDAAWERVMENMSSQAIFAAQLLAGEMPQDIEKIFEESGYSLFPQHEGEIHTECSCPDPANPCKHVAAVFYLLAEQFDEDPFLLFKMRGRSKDQLLDILRKHHGISEATEQRDELGLEPEFKPMPDDLSQFWNMGHLPDTWTVSIKSPAVRAPVIRRLGFPAFLSDELSHCLMSVYLAMEDQALDVAFSEEDNSTGANMHGNSTQTRNGA